MSSYFMRTFPIFCLTHSIICSSLELKLWKIVGRVLRYSKTMGLCKTEGCASISPSVWNMEDLQECNVPAMLLVIIFSVVKSISVWKSYGLDYIYDQRHRVFKWVGFQKSR